MITHVLSLLLAAVMTVGLSPSVTGELPASPDSALEDTAEHLYHTAETPHVGSIGGEWTVLGLARSGCEIPKQYYQDYLAAVEERVKACGGVLHERKYTEYSRVIIALSSIGADARNVAGYDLTKPLGDYDKTVWQGVNGPIWALLALDSRSYPMPTAPQSVTQATRQMYVDRILDAQLPGGGWSQGGGGAPDLDLTGMALQALAKYRDQAAVESAIEAALSWAGSVQDGSGGFSSGGQADLEGVAQMICALCELGVPLEDPRFVKNGNTMLDRLMAYYQPGGGFRHELDDPAADRMASEQGFYALVALRRIAQGKSSLYRMEDAQAVVAVEAPEPVAVTIVQMPFGLLDRAELR